MIARSSRGFRLRPLHRAALGVWALALAGCVQYEKDDDGGPAGDATAADGGDAADGAETGSPTSPTTSPTGGPTSEGTPTTGGEVGSQCDLWAQDCPVGSKCMPGDEDNDGIHDSERCVPVDDSPGQAGDDCTIEGSIASGIDDCDVGLMCWNADNNNQGRCVEMCSGTPGDPTCPEALICDISNGGVLLLCVTPCDPLTPSCPIGQVCLPGGDKQFVCDVDASGDQGGYGDACAFVNVCDQGLLCVSGQSVPGCKTDGCCTEYCDLSALDVVCAGAPEQECVSFYGGDAAPPGYENVGVCTIPS